MAFSVFSPPMNGFGAPSAFEAGFGVGFGAATGRLGFNPAAAAEMQQMHQMQQMNSMLMMLTTMLLQLLLGGGARGGGLAGLPGLSGGSSGGGGASGASGASGGSGAAASGGGGNSSQTPVGPVTPSVQNFIDKAKSHIGAPYVFGAAGGGKYDCSGLVYASLREAGVNVPRLTADGYMDMFKNSRVSKEQLQPGDLVFFYSPNSRGIGPGNATHVEIYLGNGMTMGTDNPSEGARIEPINWSSFIGGARVPQLYK